MKKILFAFSLFILTSLCYCQEKIPEKYIVQVTYTGGGTEKIEVKNDRHLNVPAPIVKDGSIFYDEEFLLLDVKKIKILNTVYGKNASTPKKSKYVVTKARYWNDRLHRFVDVNIISDPKAEQAQRESEAEQRKTAIFSRSEENQENDSPKSVEIINETEKSTVEKDTIVVSSEQIVCESDGKGNFKKIENSGLKLVGNKVNTKEFNAEFDRTNIVNNTNEYSQLLVLIPKKGMYVIEKRLNKEKQIVVCLVVPITIDTE